MRIQTSMAGLRSSVPLRRRCRADGHGALLMGGHRIAMRTKRGGWVSRTWADLSTYRLPGPVRLTAGGGAGRMRAVADIDRVGEVPAIRGVHVIERPGHDLAMALAGLPGDRR